MLIRQKPTPDTKYFDYRKRLARDKGKKLRGYFGGRNLGKTTRVVWTEFQISISQYKNGNKEPDPIGLLVRSDKLWQRIKQDYLQNLRKPPFNIDFIIEGTKLYYVQRYEKTDKLGNTTEKVKRLFLLANVIFLWSANSYKQASLEGYRMIFYDELIPEFDGYIPQEIAKFNSLVSTFSRLKGDKYIVGVCNDITDYSHYFSLFGINPDNMLEQGELAIDTKKETVLEYCPTPLFIQNLIDKSMAGVVQKDSDYGKMARGEGFLHSENYALLSKPKGHYTPRYNVYIENVSYIVHEYSKTAFWIEEGNSPYVKDYFLDKVSAIRQRRPYEFYGTDWFANDLKIKLDKSRAWFKTVEIREIFVEWLKRAF